jgi:PIN domain nuclease of toxin-antitoxin system
MAGSNYLLDTHCLLWFQENNPKIPEQIMEIIQNPENTILFSQVSLFEISIKQKIGKLPAFNASVYEIYQQGINDGFTFINIQNQHIYSYHNIPLVKDHRDPFDRLLLATALEETATFISADEQLFLYAEIIEILWQV